MSNSQKSSIIGSKILIITVFLVFYSCVKEIDTSISAFEKHVGVNCILQADSLAEAIVYKTTFITDTVGYRPIYNAEVRILREDGEIYMLKLDVDSSRYVSEKRLLSNYSYRLEVKHEAQFYTSVTNIPSQMSIIRAEMDHGKYIDEYGEKLTHWMIEIFDDTLIQNYYQMFLMDPPNLINLSQFHNISDPILVSESLLEYEPLTFLFSDQGGLNGIIPIELTGYYGTFNGIPIALQLNVRSISKEYFDFQKSWTVHYYNQSNQNHIDVLDDLDPYRIYLQGQPTALYSNIVGGVGIFAGYSESRKLFIYVE